MQTVHLFGRMNTDDADKDIPNNEIRYAKNLMPSKRSTGLRRELVRGNDYLPGSQDFFQGLEDASTAFDLSAIEVIGSFASTDDDVLYVFYKNPNYIVKVSIDAEGDPAYDFVPYENRFIWNFDELDSIYNVSLINDKLHWCQSNGEQYIIDINKNYLGKLSLFDDLTNSLSDLRKLLYLQKLPPIFPVKVEGINTGADTASKSREYLEDKSLMFTYRYIYDTDDVSTFAPWSEAQPAFRIKKADISKGDTGKISLEALQEYNLNPRFYQLKIDKKTIQSNVKAIEFASINQEETISTFKRVQRQDSWKNNYSSAPNIVVEFTGNEIGEPVSLNEALKIQQPNPFNPKSSVGFNDRIFQVGGTVGNNEEGNVSINHSTNQIDPNKGTYTQNGLTKSWNSLPLFKELGEYKVGVQFYDENIKRGFVQAVKKVKIPFRDNYFNYRYELSLQGSGAVPSWAKYYQFVRSDITNYISYFTTTVFIAPYISEYQEGTEIDTQNEFIWQDRLYRADITPPIDSFNSTHVILPKNLPFEIDNSYKIRFVTDSTDLYGSVFPILEIIGDIAVIDKVKKPTGNDRIEYKVEIFKENFEDIQILNEVGEVYPIDDWGTYHKILGDTYIVDSDFATGSRLVFPQIQPVSGNYNLSGLPGKLKRESGKAFTTTSQTTTLRQNTGATTQLETESEKTGEEFKLKNVTAGEWGLQLLGPIGAFINIINKAGVEPVFKNKIVQKYANMVVNYDLAISSKGRPNVEYKQERLVTLDSRIFYSDPFVQGSKVNGLSNFQSNNTYDLPSERGPVVTLVPIESSTVMLALHPQKTTSLYIGEGFVRQGNDAILAKTEGVIGEDRPLRGDYGTTNPESVTVYKGTAIWWDQNKKDIIRYDNNGLTPLGLSYKVRDYLESWGNALINSNANVVSGYDPYYECFFMRFPAIGSKSSETIYFSNIQGREGFLGIIEHEGESFTMLQNNLISLKGKDIFKTSNTKGFYGGPRPTVSLDFVHNEQPMATKIYENIAQNSNSPFYTEIQTNRGQFTNMIEADYRLYEDTYYTEVLRDTNTPDDLLEVGQIKLRDGNIMKGQFANVKISSDEATELNEVVIGTQLSGGQYLMD